MFDMLDNKSPLWLPAGSVRAILALALTAAFIFGRIESGIIGVVLGFYFGAKAMSSANNK